MDASGVVFMGGAIRNDADALSRLRTAGVGVEKFSEMLLGGLFVVFPVTLGDSIVCVSKRGSVGDMDGCGLGTLYRAPPRRSGADVTVESATRGSCLTGVRSTGAILFTGVRSICRMVVRSGLGVAKELSPDVEGSGTRLGSVLLGETIRVSGVSMRAPPNDGGVIDGGTSSRDRENRSPISFGW